MSSGSIINNERKKRPPSLLLLDPSPSAADEAKPPLPLLVHAKSFSLIKAEREETCDPSSRDRMISEGDRNTTTYFHSVAS
jgi:hypothetical protein